MPPKKSVFRQAGAQHFQLVHRSQRDPLINDPEASQRVLKPVGRANERGKSGNTLDDLRHDPTVAAARENEGEAATYGITYDDSSYDYMQHLKPVGQGGFDSFLIAAPRGSGVAPGMKGGAVKGKGKARAEDLFLPDGVLASEKELSLQQVYAKEENIPAELQGLQPDMNPHLRQVLEALDDEAFEVDDGEDGGDDGDWFASLVGGGEVRDGEEAPEFEFEEWGVDEQAPPKPTAADLPEDASWEERFKAFKRDQQARGDDQVSAWGGEEDRDRYDDDERSEAADTLGSLPANMADMIVSGGKKRRGKRGPSDASGMSMSSSAVFRNQGLRDLDDRFDKIEEDYEFDDEEEDFDDNMSMMSGMTGLSAASGMSGMSSMSRASLYSTTSAAPPLVSREDFDSIMDDFLDNYEVVGNKYRQALGGTQLSGPEKLQVLRAAVESEEDGIGKEENRRRILEIERLGRGVRAPKERMSRVQREEDEGEKWDVETILTTYTNTENHPGMIRSRRPAEQRARAQARANAEAQAAAARSSAANGNGHDQDVDQRTENGRSDGEGAGDEDEDDSGSETETEARVTVSRKKGESGEERKARKAAVKAERQARRAEKKSNQKTFGDERRRQIASHRKTVEGGKAADVRGTISLR